MNIKDANIIITGAASGFGREISISLGSEGANIFAIDIDEDSLQSLKETNKNINILIISDRGINKTKYGVPALIATSAIHHFLIQKGLRTLVSIVVETGEARKVHEICLLSGYGAEAINPYLGFATISNIIYKNKINISVKTAHLNYIKSICNNSIY